MTLRHLTLPVAALAVAALVTTTALTGSPSSPAIRDGVVASAGSVSAVPAAVEATAPEPVTPEVEDVAVDGVDGDALDELAAEEAAAPVLDPEVPAVTEVEPAVLSDQLTVEEFTLAGVTWDAASTPEGMKVALRLREAGQWSEWVDLDVEVAVADVDTAEADRAAHVAGTEPLMTDGADGVQVRVVTDDGTAPENLKVSLINGGESRADIAVGAAQAAGAGDAEVTTALWTGPEATVEQAGTSGSAPQIVRRAQWGADESLRSGSPSYGHLVKAVIVHHTATTNSYTSSNVAQQLRSIYAYHTQSRKWADIGYNFLVDKYGTIYEGRAGSIDYVVQGAHAGGFNSHTVGVSAIGDYSSAAPPAALVRSIGHIAGWRIGQYNGNPKGKTWLTSAGGGTARYPAGTKVNLPVISAHRDVGYTACPGDNLYAKMSTIRSIAAEYASGPVGPVPPPSPGAVPAPAPPPAAAPPPASMPADAVPVTGDVDGDGRTDVGWFHDGEWAFQTVAGKTLRATFGLQDGDVPVVGDFNDDGRDDIGIFRSGQWHVRHSVSSGYAEASFSFGRAGDVPVVGRWAGSSRDGVAVVRGKVWHLRNTPSSGVAEGSFSWGRTTDTPVVGQWLGDGIDRPGLVRGKTWFLGTSIQRPRTVWSFSTGRTTDVPVVGAWGTTGVMTGGLARDKTFYRFLDHEGTVSLGTVTFAG